MKSDLKSTIKERIKLFLLKMKCMIYPAFGYPTIQGIDVEGTLRIGKGIKGLIIKHCTFTVTDPIVIGKGFKVIGTRRTR